MNADSEIGTHESRFQKWTSDLFRPVPMDSLVAFRVAFGLAMAVWALYMIFWGQVSELYIQPKYYFSYPGLHWIQPLSGIGMYLVFSLLCVSALMLAAGWFFRFNTLFFTALFAYISLIDQANYLSYYYYVLLMALMLALSPANRLFSIDLIRKPAIRVDLIPRWSILAFEIQVALVFIFAGMAKLNADWLFAGRPLNIWLENVGMNFGFQFPDWIISGIIPILISWILLLFDFIIPHFLLDKSTSVLAFKWVLIVQLIAIILFPSGFFPVIILFSSIVFLPAELIRRWISGISYLLFDLFQFKGDVFKRGGTHLLQYRKKKLFPIILCLFLGAQIILPVVLFLQWGSERWANEAFNFSWDIRIQEKNSRIWVWKQNTQTGNNEEIKLGRYLSPHQIRHMAESPGMILQFITNKKKDASALNDDFLGKIHVLSTVSLNGSAPQPFVDCNIE